MTTSEENERIKALLLEIRNSPEAPALVRKERIVLPQWQRQLRRFQGGARYNVTPIQCGRCGTEVAVTHELFFLGIKKYCDVVCEECDTFNKAESPSD